MLAPPSGSAMVHFPVLAGRWIEPEDTDAIVLNHMTLAGIPDARVGQSVRLSIAGQPSSWRVVGIVREIGSPAAAYVSQAALARATGSDGVRIVRVTTDGDRPRAIRALEDALESAGIPVEFAIPLAELRTAVGDHMTILVQLLLAMALLLAIVGALGLASTMTISVSERRRELGVLRVLGATPREVERMVVAEGVLIALVSWPLALLLAFAASSAIGAIVGAMTFRVSLPLVLSWEAALAWLGATVLVGAAASIAPARSASNMSPREAIDHA